MIRSICILIAFIGLGIVESYAHSDFWIKSTYGNVIVKFKTGFNYEEINKTYIIGQLAEKLAKELKYKKTIFLYFDHWYIAPKPTKYAITYGNGELEWPKDLLDQFGNPVSDYHKHDAEFNRKVLFMRQNGFSFDIIHTLKLLEYGIKNAKAIRHIHKGVPYENGALVKSIDSATIAAIFSMPNSPTLNKVLENKIERENDYEFFQYGITYYWLNGTYYIIKKAYHRPDSVLMTLNSLYKFKRTDMPTALIWDSDSSFYFINNSKAMATVSGINVITGLGQYYHPLHISCEDDNRILIFRDGYPDIERFATLTKARTIIYLIKEDRLIQNKEKEERK